MENEKTPTLVNFVTKNSQLIKSAEKVCLFLLALGITLYFFGFENLNFILIIGSITTATVYFLNSFIIMEFEDLESTGGLNSIAFINFIYKLTFLALSITAISTLSLIVQGPLETMINVGALTLIIILILSLSTKIDDHSKIYDFIFYLRIVTALIINFFLINNIKHWF